MELSKVGAGGEGWVRKGEGGVWRRMLVGVGSSSSRDLLSEGGDDFDIAQRERCAGLLVTPVGGRLLESNKKCHTHGTSSTTSVQRGRYPCSEEPLVSEGDGKHRLQLTS